MTKLHKEIIETLLEDVDPDIKEVLMKHDDGYYGYDLMPSNFITEWQLIRELKRLKERQPNETL